MPICEGCNGSYSDDFKFCPYCGRAKPENPAIDIRLHITSEDAWETCEIQSTIIGEGPIHSTIYRYYAQAIGPHGIYTACSSPIWNEGDVPWGSPGEAFGSIVNNLALKGWENVATGRGQTTFRRIITPEWYESEEAEIDVADFKMGLWGVSFSFIAYARGQKGQYQIDTSPVLKNFYPEVLYDGNYRSKKIIQELKKLIQRLIQDGWICIDDNTDPWFSLIFQRPYSP